MSDLEARPKQAANDVPHVLIYRSWIAIVRDVLLILVMLFATYLGASLLHGIRQGGDRQAPSPEPAVSCASGSPTTDQWGTFCATK